jgi:hypothetical protein
MPDGVSRRNAFENYRPLVMENLIVVCILQSHLGTKIRQIFD